jgi:hypothetical protein
MCKSALMVGLAMATMVESTMIMKNPIIITQSAVQGFGECRESRAVQGFRECSARWPPFGPARRVPPGDLNVALVMHPPRFSSRR